MKDSRRSRAALAKVIMAAGLSVGWGPATVRHVAWTAVDFFPPDLARQVRKHHKRFDAGVDRGLRLPPAWRAGPPGHLAEAIDQQVREVAADLRTPVPLDQLVEEMGVLAVLVLDSNDPLAVVHEDGRENAYSAAYQSYVDSILGRVRLVYYGQSRNLISRGRIDATVRAAFERSRSLYPFVGQEFYRTGELRDWRTLDDRAVTFGVAGVALSRGLTDYANFAGFIWKQGGGRVPTPRPTPLGHVGPTITTALEGGFPDRETRDKGEPAMPRSSINLPPP